MSPRAKTHNYLNVVLGDLEAKSRDPQAWAVLLDTNGHLAEGIGSNIFLVRDGVIRTPREEFVLAGISRATVMDLATEAGFSVVEQDLDLFDAYGADEAFLTSTSLCICPVQSVNGIAPRSGAIPGPVTRQLTDAYRRFVVAGARGPSAAPRFPRAGRPRQARAPEAARSIRSFAPAWIHGKKLVMIARTPIRV